MPGETIVGLGVSPGVATGRAVGSTRFIDIRRPHRGLEIGWTWIGANVQRTAFNTEAKLLCSRYQCRQNIELLNSIVLLLVGGGFNLVQIN